MNAHEQREWDAQERAREHDADDDALARSYRRVARALDALPRPMLREGFAERVARRAAREANVAPVLSRFERLAMVALVVVFVGALVVAVQRADMTSMLDEIARSGAARWLAVLAVCVAAFAFPLSRRAGEGIRQARNAVTDSSGT